jgi:hypothetical protein
MRAKISLGILLTVALSLALMAQSAQELYQRALVQEQANGNLPEAIRLYSQAARTAGKDRSLAAKALVRIANSQEKLGNQNEAAEVYALIVRSYPEQSAEVSAAQERLGQLRRASASRGEKSQAAATDVSAFTEPLFENYCVSCHNSAKPTAGLDLKSLNAKNVSEKTSAWETILRRLRARRDPPIGSPRPDDKAYRSVVARLEQALDSAYSASNPLNVAERVSDIEWATRIATFLWSAPPDAALLDDARKGSLNDPAVLNRQVIRMLRDGKSAGFVTNFMEPWLMLDQLKNATLDPPDAELLQAMETESRLFLESQLRDDRSALELWTANYSYLNDRLARHYGVTGVTGKAFQRVTWRDRNRAGILGMSGPLTALSYSQRTSPTRRGIFVLTRFLGMEAADPPANVPPLKNVSPTGSTTRDVITAHQSNPSCANCHVTFDPPGLALENFDTVGQWRSMEGGALIDASGSFIDGTRFNGPAELRLGLLKYTDAYYTNVAQKLLAHALNRKGRTARLYDYEMPSVRAIVRSASAKDYRWSSLISGVVSSAPFRMKNVVP